MIIMFNLVYTTCNYECMHLFLYSFPNVGLYVAIRVITTDGVYTCMFLMMTNIVIL